MKRKNNIIRLLVGITLIIGSLLTIQFKYLSEKKIEKKEEKSINNFIKENNNNPVAEEIQKENINYTQYDYIGVIEIPKINLKRGFVDKNSKYNDVRYNVQILNESQMPNIEKGNFILAAHAGNTRVSFFKNIKNLSINDEVLIYFQNKKYAYKVVKTYEIEKTGYANIVRDKSKTTLTLITCKSGTNYQIIVICELKESE